MADLKQQLKTIADGAEANGTSIDTIATEYINAPSEYDGDGGIWTDNGSCGHWWTDERKTQFIAWINSTQQEQ
tara:strand:- start:286 stop:504 length:219 start_codon:yes stop_codon:yes gene_type:complete